jgi:putative Mg2+ transporter-C (MgtC) family protein
MAIAYYDLLLRLGAAVVLGGLIGYEREAHEQPAGLRTHLLVALASASFMLVSTQFVFFQRYTPDGIVRADVGRIASNVVVGIGFLGGGAILHRGISIKGLTTAASLWLVAAVGLAAGAGMFVLAVLATLISLFALVVLRYAFESPQRRVVHVRVSLDLDGDIVGRAALEDLLRPSGARVTAADYCRDLASDRSTVRLGVKIAREEHEEALIKTLAALPGVRRVRVSRLDP